ncbi:MAG: AMP-binding protein [SAR324 cluster bacterium]|nr:AMP-binding protein [SAR324 cluster bacterium]
MEQVTLGEVTNVCEFILNHGRLQPEKIALAVPKEWDTTNVHRYETATFGEMYRKVGNYQEGFRKLGLKDKDRVIILFRPGVDFYAIVLALLSGGQVPLFIEAGMGFKRIYQALEDSKAVAVISMEEILKYRFLLPVLLKMKLFSIDSTGFLVRSVNHLYVENAPPLTIVPRKPTDYAIITFTSGSTGRPKAADRNHGSLLEQHHAIKANWTSDSDDVDMTCFPVFVLHNMSCGITSVLPAIDLTKPAEVSPPVVLSQTREWGVTRMSGAPAYVSKIINYLREEHITIPSLRGIACGGAPVPRELCKTIVETLPHAESAVVYGSTEAEPVAHVHMSEIAESEGEGFLVGKPVALIELEIVTIPDELPRVDERGLVPYRVKTGEPGEIVVKGRHVLREYIDNPRANRENKIQTPDGNIWHRTGDVGYQDAQGRIWLLGRRSDMVLHHGKQLFPFKIEIMVNALEGIRQSALVQHPDRSRGILFVELKPGASSISLQTKLNERVLREKILGLEIRVLDQLPMDGRHNSKVDRPKLRKMLMK